MSYVYIKSEPQLWTVGFYAPNGTWESESDHGIREDAARRVAYLNGGGKEPEAFLDMRAVLVDVYEFWAGGDVPAPLASRIEDVLRRTKP